MRAAILTDSQTVADLVQSEHFEVKPLAGETIELFQRDRDSGGDTVTSLLRTPGERARDPVHARGRHAHRERRRGTPCDRHRRGWRSSFEGRAGLQADDQQLARLSDPMALMTCEEARRGRAVGVGITGAGKTPLVVLAPASGTAGAPLHATIHPNPEWFADLTLEVAPKTIRTHQSWILPVRIVGFALAALLFVLSARIAAGTRRSPAPRADRPG